MEISNHVTKCCSTGWPAGNGAATSGVCVWSPRLRQYSAQGKTRGRLSHGPSDAPTPQPFRDAHATDCCGRGTQMCSFWCGIGTVPVRVRPAQMYIQINAKTEVIALCRWQYSNNEIFKINQSLINSDKK